MTANLFTNVRVIDGAGEAPFAGEVLIKGNRTASVHIQHRRSLGMLP